MPTTIQEKQFEPREGGKGKYFFNVHPSSIKFKLKLGSQEVKG